MSKYKEELMAIREYAKHRDISQQAISDAVKDGGKIFEAVVMKRSRVKIRVQYADQLWKERTISTNSNEHHSNPNESKPAPTTGSAGAYAKARSVKETFGAKLAQIKFEQESGKLCNVEDVEKAFFNIGRVTRDNLMVLPDKLSPVLASENNIDEIREILTKEIQSCLDNLSRMDLTHLQESNE